MTRRFPMPFPTPVPAVIVLLFLAAPMARAASDLVRPALLADVDAVSPAATFTVAVRLEMKTGWHTYWVNPGEAGEPTRIRPSGPAGFEFAGIPEGAILLLQGDQVARFVSAGAAASMNRSTSGFDNRLRRM